MTQRDGDVPIEARAISVDLLSYYLRSTVVCAITTTVVEPLNNMVTCYGYCNIKIILALLRYHIMYEPWVPMYVQYVAYGGDRASAIL